MQLKKTLILLITTLSWIAGIGQLNSSQYQVPDIPVMNEWQNVNLIHVDFTNFNRNVGDSIFRGEKIGEIQAEPESYSNHFDKEIKQSSEFYKLKNYKKAIEILKKPILEEPDNFFVLNCYARACYWEKKEESYKVYKSLINMLDSVYQGTESKIPVDLWFREAYWKLGTLYMDNSLFEQAYYEISRSLICMQDIKGEPIYCQALEYLTECAYMLKEDELARHLAKRTLFYDPGNAYVTEIIKKLDNDVK